jgi:hypothetical protein
LCSRREIIAQNMQPIRPMHPMPGANTASRSFSKSVTSSKLSVMDFSQVHAMNGSCNCPFCLWTTGTRWSNEAPKHANAGSQTERYSNQQAFFEDDPKKMTAAMLHNTRRTMRPCFFGWLQVVEVNLKVKRRQQMTLTRWKKQSAYTCLKGWIDVLSDKKDFLRKGAKVMQMMMNTGLVSSMEKWKSETKKSKGSKKILAKVISTMQKLQLRKALHGWAFKVDLMVARKQMLRKVAEIWWGNISQKYFELWFEISRAEVELRQQVAAEGTPPTWKPPRHVFILQITATIQNLVSDGIGKVGLTFCGLNTTSEIVYLDFEGTLTAHGNISSYTHLGKITSILLEDTKQSLRFNRIDVQDETLGLQYLFLDAALELKPVSIELPGVLRAVRKFGRKAVNSADLVQNAGHISDAGEKKRKLLPSGEPSIIAEPRPPPVVKKLRFALDTSNLVRSKIQAIQKWIRRSVVDIKLLHTAPSTNYRVVDLYLEYSRSDAESIAPAMKTIHAFCKRLCSRTAFVKSWKSGRTLAFLCIVALQRQRFQSYCLQINFLWSRISSHHIRAQYIQSWNAAFSLMNYLRVRSTPIVLERNQRAANVLLRGLKRFRSIMYYRKWLKWKSCLQGWMLALQCRRRLKCAMHLKRCCLAKFGAHRKRFQEIRSSALYITMTIKADAVSRRIQRMYLHGLDCVRLIQSHLRVQFQKKVRAKVKRLLHEREQHALVELQKVTELKTLLEQCHSPEPSAAYWRKYGKAENPGDVKPMNLSWAAMQSIVRKTAVPVVAFDQQRLKTEVEQGHNNIEEQAMDQTETLRNTETNNITTTRDTFDPELVNATQVHRVLSSGNHLGNSPFFKRIEAANVRAAELRKNGYEGILKLQRSARGFQSKHLVHEMKLGSPSPERLGSASEILSLPEIRATFRQLRNEEFPELLVHWAPPVKGMCAPILSRNSSDQKRVPNPPSILTRNAQAFMSLRSKRLSLQKHDSS